MLTELHIRNFALVEELRLELGPGLSVLTGETGAGKSIIVDAMTAALGERTSSEVVRTGADKCLVEAVFELDSDSPACEVAAQLGYEPDGGLLILSREITAAGKSQCRINGRPITASALREITSHLVDIHGQHEHQSLLSVPTHVEILDSWCGTELLALREKAASVYTELQAAVNERNRLLTDERERARLLDLYTFQAEEITAAALQPGEDEELAAERNRLANAERLFAAAAEIHEALGAEGSSVDKLSSAAMAADRMAGLDPTAAGIAESVNAALIAAQEAMLAVRDYEESIESDPSRLEQIEDRLDSIRTLKRKYGDTIEEVIAFGNDLAGKIDALAHSEERSQELSGRIDELTSDLTNLCGQLTELRKSTAPEFARLVERELADLAMEKTRFEVSIEPVEPGPTGADSVEFLISPNPGEPVKPLVKIVSGGEMSRVMLALKGVASPPSHPSARAGMKERVPSLVFDEIDSGIGGLTAQVLGDKLASLARVCQVMCVTHLPQIASRADRHYAVEKRVEAGRSFVRIRELGDEDRVIEVARMLGGEGAAGAAALHAREMLSLADQRNG